VKDFTHDDILAYVLMEIKDIAAITCHVADKLAIFGHNFSKTSE